MREIDTIIIHCSDTYVTMDIGADIIRGWHVDGRGWDDIGYHRVYKRDGSIEQGRPDEIMGAHAYGMNQNSLGLVLIGGKAENGGPEFNYTWRQMKALREDCERLQTIYRGPEIIGHCDVPGSGKTCPNFNVKAWRNAA